ncbi:MAG: glutathione S-transferase [Methylobacteriaceae bacterium]|nr:glutathione S-transferase [Methylobacteriaceae bacterium]
MIDSNAIIDHLDEVYGHERPLTPPGGADRRAVLKVAAILMGGCEKCLHVAYERNRRPPQKLYQPWIDDCIAQVKNAFAAVDTMIDPKKPYLLFERLTHANVTAVVAERLARGLGIDTDEQTTRLRALTRRLAEEPFFHVGEP